MRDVTLTMSNRQALTIPVDADLGDTNSTNEIPNPPAGENQPSGNLPVQGVEWVVIAEENADPAVQVEGVLLARLQFSRDAGATWETDDELEVSLAEDPATPDPALSTDGVAVRRVGLSRRFREELAVTDLTQVRFRTVYSTSARTTSDAATTVAVTSYLTRVGGE